MVKKKYPLPTMFSNHPKKSFKFSFKFILSSANAFNLWQCKFFTFGKELIHQQQVSIKVGPRLSRKLFAIRRLSTCPRGLLPHDSAISLITDIRIPSEQNVHTASFSYFTVYSRDLILRKKNSCKDFDQTFRTIRGGLHLGLEGGGVIISGKNLYS